MVFEGCDLEYMVPNTTVFNDYTTFFSGKVNVRADYASMRVKYFAVYDRHGDSNFGSNTISIDNPLGHNAGGGMYIANNFVSWNHTVCITPQDATFQQLTPDQCEESYYDEGGSYHGGCRFKRINVGFWENNDSVFYVNSSNTWWNNTKEFVGYENHVYIDDELVTVFYSGPNDWIYNPETNRYEYYVGELRSGDWRYHEYDLTYSGVPVACQDLPNCPETSRPITTPPHRGLERFGLQYWGTHPRPEQLDGGVHEVKVVLDAGGKAIHAGSVYVKFCNFTYDEEGDLTAEHSMDCGCGWELDPREGLTVSGKTFKWKNASAPQGSAENMVNCIAPEDIEEREQGNGVVVTIMEHEAQNMTGATADAAGYTSVMPPYQTKLSVLTPSLFDRTELKRFSPMTLQSGQYTGLSHFLSVDGYFDERVRTLEVVLDSTGQLSTGGGLANFGVFPSAPLTVDFQVCYPSDLLPGDGITFVANEEDGVNDFVAWDNEGSFCLYPENAWRNNYKDNTLIYRLQYSMFNDGAYTARSDTSDEAWPNYIYLDGTKVATTMSSGPLAGGGKVQELTAYIEVYGLVDVFRHDLELRIDGDNMVRRPPGDGSDYRGPTKTTVSDYECRPWNYAPLLGPDYEYWNTTKYPDNAYLLEQENVYYCRNPDGSNATW
eukprot:gene3073-3902_t